LPGERESHIVSSPGWSSRSTASWLMTPAQTLFGNGRGAPCRQTPQPSISSWTNRSSGS
jgi:hypothetical protein